MDKSQSKTQERKLDEKENLQQRVMRLLKAYEEDSKKKRKKEEEAEKALLKALRFFRQNAILETPRLNPEKLNTVDQLFEQLKHYCENEETGFKNKFSEISPHELMHIRKYGKNCYTLEELYQYVKAQTQANQPVRNPATQDIWDKELQSAILNQYKTYVDHEATF